MKIDQTKPIIYVDMDGVLCDFAGPALALHGKSVDDITPGEWCLSKAIGCDLDSFWAPIHAAGAAFWAGLPRLPWADDLLSACDLFGRELYICTSPSKDGQSMAGKLAWLQEHYPTLAGRFFMTGHKHMLARPDAVLVDDSDKNCLRFIQAGGKAALLPSRWNGRHSFTASNLDMVLMDLRLATGRA